MQGHVTRSVEEYYRDLISDLPSGEKLPSERTVMAELGVCRSTVRIVLTKLVAQDVIRPRHGKGYFKL